MLLCTGKRIKRGERFSVAYAIGFFQRLCGRCEHRGARMPITLRERTCAFFVRVRGMPVTALSHRLTEGLPCERHPSRGGTAHPRPLQPVLRTGVF